MAFIELKFFADRSDIRKLLSHQKFIIEQLLEIKNQQNQMAQELNALVDRLETALTNIRQDIQDIKNGLPSQGGLTPEQTEALKSRLQTVVSGAEALDAENEANPPEEEEPGEGPVPA